MEFLRSKRDDNRPELGEHSGKLWIPASLTSILMEQTHSPKKIEPMVEWRKH